MAIASLNGLMVSEPVRRMFWQGMNFGPIYTYETLAVNSSNGAYNYGFNDNNTGWSEAPRRDNT